MDENILRAENTIDPVSGINIMRHTMSTAMSTVHSHDFMEIFIILEGSVLHVVNGVSISLQEGDIVLIRPNDRHCYQYIRKTKCELVNLAFPLERFKEAQEFIGPEYSIGGIFDSVMPPIRRLSSKEKCETLEKMMRANEILLDDPKYSRIIFKLLIIDMLCLFRNEKKGRERTVMPEWMQRTSLEMQKKENLNRGLPALRTIACRSNEHISRSFKAYLNRTPTEFINEIRVKYAASCLLNTEEKIDFIASESGFENLSHFYHLFKDKYGVSPRQFRLMNKKSAIPVS